MRYYVWFYKGEWAVLDSCSFRTTVVFSTPTADDAFAECEALNGGF